ncbi:glycosyl hydrolase [Lacibacter sp.]|uniref:glycosyl hydrolase n=1 Tax=Lacibacter sp. TaxID=1915409 RepID=UPI002B4AF64B|nr:glycosyl hydrolase [Lacibacter sp.]HLP38212.1 glycosyl hydrolase [Lacibacter sp.]
MRKKILHTYCLLIALIASSQISAQTMEQRFLNPPQSAKPWVFWYWMHAAVSKEGITADLEAMKEVGIGGAYLMPIKDTVHRIPFQPTARQLSPEWWSLVKFSMQEAKRLGLQLGMHVSDGFALAGGPWITPELSMQKLVWTKTYVCGGSNEKINLLQPEGKEDYYRDIAVYAYPAVGKAAFSEVVLVPSVTTSSGIRASFLSFQGSNNQSYKSDSSCWIQYKYPKPFTCRSIRIKTGGNSYQAHRLSVLVSDDGVNFRKHTQLQAPRHGWQDADEDVTHAVPEVTAQYFRFVYEKEGSEPGSEDLDAAKWKPSLKVIGIYLSDEPMINQYESKNGSVWRISETTTKEQVTDAMAIPMKNIVNLTGKMDADGNLNWRAPAGNWVIVRIGHTSTGHTNYTGGAGLGLEVDKFNASAVKLQFDNWFGKAFAQDAALAKQVLKVFHVDSWECGSQNWGANFANEFKKRRGYDLMPYLLVMAGVPIENATRSEKILHDVRTTIAELVNDVFYTTLKKEAHALGCVVSAESIAPTMVSDGLMHYKHTDLPMGEFWLNSPTHDKPNDMRDAISGAHIYGKKIIQSESFTSVRMNWGEHPGNLKVVGDRNFALGINKMVLHVFTHNPWLDKKPGMTLDGVGLYFQRDQTWFKQSKAWIEYLTRCQSLLQMGDPVVDVAVFTGEEIPRRSILPDRLISTLPGIFGKEKVEAEKKRLENKNQPLRQIPDGVTHSANMADPEDWIDPLNGYTYNSFNPDALMMMQVKNGRVVLPGGASYGVLVIPGKMLMNPNPTMSAAVQKKLQQLANAGAKMVVNQQWIKLFAKNKNVAAAPYMESSFEKLGVKKDVEIEDNDEHAIAWTHRTTKDAEIYFLSNQSDSTQNFKIKFRVGQYDHVEYWNPVTGEILDYSFFGGNSKFGIGMAPGDAYFLVFRKTKETKAKQLSDGITEESEVAFSSTDWKIQFAPEAGGPSVPVKATELKSWTISVDSTIKYYSGTAVYSRAFEWKDAVTNRPVYLEIDSLYNIATVKLNGIECGTVWTFPYSLDVTKALKQGTNTIEIAVTNTWHNRLIGDQLLPEAKRITWTTAPFRLKDKPLLPAGIVGEVKLIVR